MQSARPHGPMQSLGVSPRASDGPSPGAAPARARLVNFRKLYAVSHRIIFPEEHTTARSNNQSDMIWFNGPYHLLRRGDPNGP